MSSKYCLLAMLVVFLAAVPASAYIINETTNTPLFYDGYESQPAANISHTGYQDPDHNCLPVDSNVLYGGSYYYYHGGWGNVPTQYETFQVTNHTGAGNSPYESQVDPGAYTGENYLRHFRLRYEDYVTMAERFAVQSTAGNIVHWEKMVYVSQSAEHAFAGSLRDFTTSITAINFVADEDGKIYNNGSSVIDGITYEYGEWQKWELDYAVGATTYSLTVDGTTVSGIAVANNTGYIDAISYTMYPEHYDTGPVYLDEPFAVPEPSAFALLAAGLIGLLAYAWKKMR